MTDIPAWRVRLARFAQVWAYAKVGVVNAMFGYLCYAALIFVGLGAFAAQLLAHLLGMAFNYFMFRRHVFKDSDAAIIRYIAAYAVNYVVGLGVLALLKTLVASDYIAGFLSIVIVAILNFVILKFLVFRPRSVQR